MKQLLQSFGTGETMIVDVPMPCVKKGYVLVRTLHSLISAGTERMLVDFGKAGLIEKARKQPEKLRQVIEKVQTDGLLPTVEAVKSKLDTPIPLGYCNCGVVEGVGQGVGGLEPGDLVVSNGAHAEIVSVPANLTAKVPDGVPSEQACFAALGAVGLQAVRLAAPQLGELFVVTGLGLLGLMTVQLLRASGCRVLGVDPDPSRCETAASLGARVVDLSKSEDLLSAAAVFSRGFGVDGVIITASTRSNVPVKQAARVCRKRGRIVLAGVVGLELDRSDFYEKEISFTVSCSFGPGRYDPAYEEQGVDYPFGYVRWTEQRNFTAVLDTMATGALKVGPLVSHRIPFREAPSAYEILRGDEPCLAIVLEYPDEPDTSRNVVLKKKAAGGRPGEPVVGIIGAGNFSSRMLIPAFDEAGARIKTVCSTGGVSAVVAGARSGVENASTDVDAVICDDEITVIAVATRHDSHADIVCRALSAGKHVYCEKPLCISRAELLRVKNMVARLGDACPKLMIGFNRRFAPQVKKMKSLLGAVRYPKSIIITVNAGALPKNHWVQDPDVGGGRIIGEGCHFVDLLSFLVGCDITGVNAVMMGEAPGVPVRRDKMTFTIGFSDGSFGTVHYLANGSRAFPKERIEVFCGESVLQLENFRKMWGYGWPGFKKMNLWAQDKGHSAAVAAFVEAVKSGGPSPIDIDEIFEVTDTVFTVVEEAEKGFGRNSG